MQNYITEGRQFKMLWQQRLKLCNIHDRLHSDILMCLTPDHATITLLGRVPNLGGHNLA